MANQETFTIVRRTFTITLIGRKALEKIEGKMASKLASFEEEAHEQLLTYLYNSPATLANIKRDFNNTPSGTIAYDGHQYIAQNADKLLSDFLRLNYISDSVIIE